MTSPSEKAPGTIEKPSVAKPANQSYLHHDDPTSGVNTGKKEMPRQFAKMLSYQMHHLEIAHTCAMPQSFPYRPFA